MTREQRQQRLSELTRDRVAIPAAVYASLASEVLPTELQTWPWSAYLWDRPTAATWPYSEHVLTAAQDAWDEGNAFVKTRLEVAAARAEQEATIQAERDAQKAADHQVTTDALTDELRQVYLSQPGTSEASFAAALPAMLEQRARDAALSSLRQAKSPISRRQILA